VSIVTVARAPFALCASFVAAACATAPSPATGPSAATTAFPAAASRARGGALALPDIAAANCPAPRGDTIKLGALLDELGDLSSLSRVARPGYTSSLSSSFDRASLSASPGEPDWFANKDFTQPVPGEPVVLLDASGPGVVTRIWSANPSGTMRIYLDGSAIPIVQAPMAALLDGGVQPLGAPYAFVAANGHNLYFPIPFSRGCKITVETDAKRFYYQVDYRRYSDGTKVQSFSAASLAEAGCQKARTAARLQLAANGALPQLPAAEAFQLEVEPGSRTEHRLLAASGGSVIRELRVRPSSLDPAALRGTLLSFEFDGEQTVEVPLGDFFGTGPGLATVRSLPITVDAERGVLIARWPMPYRVSATIALTSAVGPKLTAAIEVASEPLPWTDESLYFGAQWHAPDSIVSAPASDWPLFVMRGAGKYVGTLLNVQNGDLLWWGEGDERISVDGERFPSHFGTGTEDYFGFGWCSNERFTAPFIGQTQSSGRQNWGATSLYRFHVFDAIPFRTGLRFDLEVRHWRKHPVPLVYDAIAYFYARPGAVAEPKASDPARYRLPLEANPPLDMSPAHYSCGGD
jgi:hypothetical protein